MAHEMFSAVAAMYGVENANNIVLGKWVDTYHGLLGTALPDTFTTEFFLKTFDPFYAKLFDGIRHDSGDPKIWLNKFINHYEKLGIDIKTKRVVFSDGIDSFDRVENILKEVNRSNATFLRNRNMAHKRFRRPKTTQYGIQTSKRKKKQIRINAMRHKIVRRRTENTTETKP